jgi:endothelin-converting enzyme/putative endopeptidase
MYPLSQFPVYRMRRQTVPILKRCCLILAAFLLSPLLRAQSNSAAPPPQPDHFSLDAVDSSIDPCTNFYQYSCKKWMAANPIPPDQPAWGHGGKLALWNQYVLKDVLEKASADSPSRSAIDQKIGDYYSSCMNESAIDAKGLAAIQAELDLIASLRSTADLGRELAHIHAITFQLVPPSDSGFATALFGFTSSQDLDDSSKVVAALDQGGLGLPDRDYYLKDDAKSVELRKQYVDHITKTFVLLGESPTAAAVDAKTDMDMETALAKASMDIVMRRDPANLNHKLSAQQLRALMPAFSWDDYLKALNPPSTIHYLVTSPDFFKEVNQLITAESLDHWKIYLRYQLVNVSSPLLSAPFADERFDFYGLKQQRPRWRRCTQYVDRDLGEALGQAYVDRTFGADGKARMLKLVHALEASLQNDIQQLDWMTPATKQQALVKLHGFEDKIGYPDKWRDYSSLKIVRGDAMGNAFRSSEFELHRQLAKIGKPVDREEWGMTPPTVNAYYDSQLNTINFPAGILQPPFFDKQADDAANFGSIGAIIGHEMTHGFDDEGRKFDATGNLRDWWTAEDGKEFEHRVECVADEYSAFEATPGTKVNGHLTLGENTADNGGARIALMALKDTLKAEGKSDLKEDGFTPEQRFFIAYGQSWCSNMTPELLRVLAQSNPHSPPEFRVNGVVSNMPEFQQAFGCKKGQPMVRDNACHVW